LTTEARPGQIELADEGTLFLDEIATLTLPLQTKLLRVLEDRQVQRLGGRTLRKIDFRLISATNDPLEEMVRTGRFREDLYYRITTASMWCRFICRRCGSAAAAFHCCATTSSRSTAKPTGSGSSKKSPVNNTASTKSIKAAKTGEASPAAAEHLTTAKASLKTTKSALKSAFSRYIS
jgi:Sigma-54 interaction domain